MPVRLKMTSCQSSTDIISIHGVEKEKLLNYKKIKVDAQEMDAFIADTSGALVGEKIANRYGWKIGQNIILKELGNVSFNIRGKIPSRGSADDFLIFVGRKFLQEADSEQGVSHYVLVKAKDGTDYTAVCKAIDALPMTIQTQSQPEEAMLTTILDQLSDLVKLSRGVIVIIIMVVLIAMGNAISMATRDRWREFGILRTIGYSKQTIMMLVLGEGLILGFAGALCGCLIVQILASAHLVKSIATCAITVEFSMGMMEWLKTGIVITAAAVIGSLIPARSAANLDIVDALKPEE